MKFDILWNEQKITKDNQFRRLEEIITEYK